MGADMTLAWTAWPVIEGTEDHAPGSPAVAGELKRRWSEVMGTGERLAEVMDTFGVDSDTPDDVESWGELAEGVPGLLDTTFGGSGSWDRDLTTGTIGGRQYVFTGGLSWGDDPTDAYRLIGAIAASGITDEPIPKGIIG